MYWYCSRQTNIQITKIYELLVAREKKKRLNWTIHCRINRKRIAVVCGTKPHKLKKNLYFLRSLIMNICNSSTLCIYNVQWKPNIIDNSLLWLHNLVSTNNITFFSFKRIKWFENCSRVLTETVITLHSKLVFCAFWFHCWMEFKDRTPNKKSGTFGTEQQRRWASFSTLPFGE